MDHFKLQLRKKEISEQKHTSKLKKLITEYYRLANSSAAQNYKDGYARHSPLDYMQNKLRYLKLSHAAKARYEEIGGDMKKLPQFLYDTEVNVEVTMTLQEAFEWVQSQQGTVA